VDQLADVGLVSSILGPVTRRVTVATMHDRLGSASLPLSGPTTKADRHDIELLGSEVPTTRKDST
jgi:hypothetical protein